MAYKDIKICRVGGRHAHPHRVSLYKRRYLGSSFLPPLPYFILSPEVSNPVTDVFLCFNCFPKTPLIRLPLSGLKVVNIEGGVRSLIMVSWYCVWGELNSFTREVPTFGDV